MDWEGRKKFSFTHEGSSLVVTLWGTKEITRPRRLYEGFGISVISHVAERDFLVGYELLFDEHPTNVVIVDNLAAVFFKPPSPSDEMTALFQDTLLRIVCGEEETRNYLVSMRYGKSKN